MPSPRLASVIGHSPTTAPDCRDALELPCRRVRGMHQTPARHRLAVNSNRRSIGRRPHQATQSSTSRICSATWMWIGASRGKRHDSRQLLRRHGPQTVRRHAHDAARQACSRLAARLHDARETLEIGHEAALARARLAAAEAAVGIEGRQQRERDAGVGGGRRDASRKLTGIGERHARLVLVQVMKLADAREACLEHLRERERRDRLELLGIDPLDEPIHELAPGPEAVVRGPAALREARDGALEGVTVQVGQPGNAHRVALIVVGRRRPRSRWSR